MITLIAMQTFFVEEGYAICIEGTVRLERKLTNYFTCNVMDKVQCMTRPFRAIYSDGMSYKIRRVASALACSLDLAPTKR